jgi:hypothetical protein
LGDIPGTSGDIPGTTGDIPGTTGDIPANAGDIPRNHRAGAAPVFLTTVKFTPLRMIRSLRLPMAWLKAWYFRLKETAPVSSAARSPGAR